jgi:hypothetical protein
MKPHQPRSGLLVFVSRYIGLSSAAATSPLLLAGCSPAVFSRLRRHSDSAAQMYKVSAHNREWCSALVLLEGHSDAQAQFLRWLKKSDFARLEVTGSALAPLRKAQVVKSRAPIGTLVVVEELATIAQTYNARRPKYKVEDVLDGLVWKGTITLEDPPAIKKGKQKLVRGEADLKKPKLDTLADGERLDDASQGSALWLGFLSAQEALLTGAAPSTPPALANIHSYSVSDAPVATVLEDAAPGRPWFTGSFGLSCSFNFSDASVAIAEDGATSRLWFTGSFGH